MRNHFDYATELYLSKLSCRIKEDLIFVFSNREQQEKLIIRIKEETGETPKNIVIPEDLLQYKSQINVKKLYALKQLKDEYAYLFVIDCEALFLKNADFYEVAEDIWNNRTMLNATKSSDAWKLVLRPCYTALNLQRNLTLLKETRGWLYNIWFNEIPLYRTDNLDDFFSWLESFDKSKYLNSWACFDYHLYVAFLLIKMKLHLKRYPMYKAKQGYVEALNKISDVTFELKNYSLEMLHTHWTSDIEIVTNDTYMLCQRDRSMSNNSESNYGGGIRMNIKRLVRVVYDCLRR